MISWAHQISGSTAFGMNHISFCQSRSAQSRSLGSWLVWLHFDIPCWTGPKSFCQVFFIGKTKMIAFDLVLGLVSARNFQVLTLRPQKWQKSPISFCLAGEFLFKDSMDMRTICLFLYLLIWHKQSTDTVKPLYNLLAPPIHIAFKKTRQR